MGPNPFLGVFFHWLGVLASGSFYVPFRFVRKWSWEVYWLAGGFFSWIIAPWVFAWLLVPDPVAIIRQADERTLTLAYVFGALWGLGGLTFGLTMRYLGIGLGMAVALGYCAAVGTLTPPIIEQKFGELLVTSSGVVTLLGVFVCLAGIAVTGLAGMNKEKELSDEQKKAAVAEFNFTKGFFVATFSGVMSACFAIGLFYGKPIMRAAEEVLRESGRSDLWSNLPVLIVVLLGGFTTNFIWCLILLVKNRTARQYIRTTYAPGLHDPKTIIETAIDAPSEEVVRSASLRPVDGLRVPLLTNYLFSALAGVTWYLQFFFYSMGQMRMGKYEFSSWTLHMASIIIFSSLWGIALKEWKGSSRKTRRLLSVGLLTLILSTIIVGYGNYLGAQAAH
ncbi:MAG: L-rhamnose/proton symporter RhaT [Verrucomicrobia bacterium]|nr:L-rhamnose/proton symporter RhaT [Verrucomicrobiota bacterium]